MDVFKQQGRESKFYNLPLTNNNGGTGTSGSLKLKDQNTTIIII